MNTQMNPSRSSQAIAARVNAIHFQFLIGGERRDQLALAAVCVESPSVITALDLLAVEVSAGKRHAAMGAGVAQGERFALGSRPRTSGISSSMALS